ncbi:AAA family ATPase, partial [Stenotrophomonas sp. 3diitr2024]
MKIKQVALYNYKSHRKLDLSFESDVTIISGNNGEGKSSVLGAIRDVFGRIHTKLPGLVGISPKLGDVRIQSTTKLSEGLHVWAQIDISRENASLDSDEGLNDGVIEVSRTRLRDRAPETVSSLADQLAVGHVVGTKNLDGFIDRIISADARGEAYLMPVVAYYGTDRAVFDTPLRRRNFKTHFPRFDGLNGSLSSNSNFKRVFEWFHAKETEESLRQKKLRSFDYLDPELSAVREAIERFMPGFRDPRTVLRPLRFVVDKAEGNSIRTFELNQLSDGHRTCLAMVVDLACRMVESNPSDVLANPLEAEAVVLIDEVDLHLHPSWQQVIIPDLLRVFPNTQFVITTHSPQVMSSVESRCIRKLVVDEEETRVLIPSFALGARSVDVMEDVQEVDARPPNAITAKLDR